MIEEVITWIIFVIIDILMLIFLYYALYKAEQTSDTQYADSLSTRNSIIASNKDRNELKINGERTTHIDRTRRRKTSNFSNYQRFKTVYGDETRTAHPRKRVQENQTADSVTEIKAELSRIASYINSENAIVSNGYSKEELLSLKKHLLEKKDQLTALLILLKDNRTEILKREYTKCVELLTAIEPRMILIDEKIEELSNTWLIENKRIITEVFKSIREYGKFIELDVLHEIFPSKWSTLKELCDFLERVEYETSIWTFDGKYVELKAKNYPKKGTKAKQLNCQICKKPITSKDDHECCPECLSHFHYSHLAEWLKIKRKCPVCKKNIRIEQK